MSLRKYRAKRKEEKKESIAFKELMKKRRKAAQRRAYEEEALKVARERGKELARRPSLGKRVLLKARTTMARTAPTPRQIRRSPVRTRKTYKRYPVKRTRRTSAPIRKPQPTRSVIEDLF